MSLVHQFARMWRTRDYTWECMGKGCHYGWESLPSNDLEWVGADAQAHADKTGHDVAVLRTSVVIQSSRKQGGAR